MCGALGRGNYPFMGPKIGPGLLLSNAHMGPASIRPWGRKFSLFCVPFFTSLLSHQEILFLLFLPRISSPSSSSSYGIH